MIIEALKKRRNEISEQVRKLKADLVHLDATIRIFAGENPKPQTKRGDVSRVLLDTLREAGQPISINEIAAKTGIDTKRLGRAIDYQRSQEVVRSVSGVGQIRLWELA